MCFLEREKEVGSRAGGPAAEERLVGLDGIRLGSLCLQVAGSHLLMSS